MWMCEFQIQRMFPVFYGKTRYSEYFVSFYNVEKSLFITTVYGQLYLEVKKSTNKWGNLAN